MIYFIEGLAMGLLVSAPVGPIGAICIHHAMTRGFSLAFFTGLGAAFADATIATLACFGVTLINQWLIAHHRLINGIGGTLLLLMAYYLFTTSYHYTKYSIQTPLHAFLYTYFLTFSNPIMILVFITLFGAFGIEETTITLFQGIQIVFGVLLGGLLWWVSLSYLATHMSRKISPKSLITIRKITAILLFLFGISEFASIFV